MCNEVLFDRVDCPECNHDNAYRGPEDGHCPDCDHVWDVEPDIQMTTSQFPINGFYFISR